MSIKFGMDVLWVKQFPTGLKLHFCSLLRDQSGHIDLKSRLHTDPLRNCPTDVTCNAVGQISWPRLRVLGFASVLMEDFRPSDPAAPSLFF